LEAEAWAAGYQCSWEAFQSKLSVTRMAMCLSSRNNLAILLKKWYWKPKEFPIEMK
jgi:hypothetical protein